MAVAWLGLLALILFAPAQAAARAHPGMLDRAFGKDGKVTVAIPAEDSGAVGVRYEVPFQFAPGHLQMAAAPGGKVVVAGSTRIVRLLPNGKLDPSFGDGGVVSVDRPQGQIFLLADVAVDSAGRVLLAGSARPLPTESTPDPLLSTAVVRRYAADGSVDTSFGTGGTVITDFGIAAPKVKEGPPYKGPSVGLQSMVVDSEGRPILTGASITELVRCSGEPISWHSVSTGFVARLTEAGAMDPSFGAGGLRQIADFGSFAQGHGLVDGDLLALGTPSVRGCNESPGRPVLTSLDGSGSPAPGFGFAGFRTIGFRKAPVVARAPSGKILLLGPKTKVGNHRAQQLVMRLLPSGSVDPGFGRSGRVNVSMPRAAGFAAIGADGRERLLLAGHVSSALSRSGPRRTTFTLTRVKPNGSLDRSFGRRGVVKTGFGGPSDSRATQILLGGNRILVGGVVSTPKLATGGGFAIARYLGGGR